MQNHAPQYIYISNLTIIILSSNMYIIPQYIYYLTLPPQQRRDLVVWRPAGELGKVFFLNISKQIVLDSEFSFDEKIISFFQPVAGFELCAVRFGNAR